MGRVAVLAGGLALWGVAPAFAEYAVQSGDVIEISVAGLPDLKQRSVVGLAGEISVPMIAPVRVAGLSLPEVQKKIKAELSQKLYQQHASDGREAVTAISPEAVMVSIIEYRPVYLSGDVTKPGASDLSARHDGPTGGGAGRRLRDHAVPDEQPVPGIRPTCAPSTRRSGCSS